MTAPDPSPERDEINELLRQLEAEKAGAKYWRDAARHRQGLLDEIKGRTSVRAVLSIERRATPLRRRIRTSADAARSTLGMLLVAAEAVPHRRALSERQSAIDALTSALEPPEPLREKTTVVVVGTADLPGWATALRSEQTTVHTASTPAEVSGVLEGTGDEAELVCIVDSDVEPLTPGWLARLALSMRGAGAAAATAVMVHPRRPLKSATPHDLLVRSAGYHVDESAGAPHVKALLAAADPTTVTDDTVALAGGGLFLVDRVALVAAGGYRPHGSCDVAAIDMSLRLAAQGGVIVRSGPTLAVDHRPTIPSDRTGRLLFDEGSRNWSDLLDRHGPALMHLTPRGTSAKASFWLTVAAPNRKVADRWGDWHLAQALARALADLGHRAAVGTQAELDEPARKAADVHLVLRGLASSPRSSGQHNVIWVISHPEDLDSAECDEADLVLVASPLFATHLRTSTATPVEVLLQATDTDRFRPATDHARRHDLIVVAKSRDVMRPMVADAIAAGLRPSIHGSGWDGLVDPDLLVTDHVANEDLPALYAGAGVVLNDHWDTMRTWGFLSNRIFDALACGTPVLSDPAPGLQETFGDLVPTWNDPEELRRAVERSLTMDRSAFAQRARAWIEANHSMAHRAVELVDFLVTHGLIDEYTRRSRPRNAR